MQLSMQTRTCMLDNSQIQATFHAPLRTLEQLISSVCCCYCRCCFCLIHYFLLFFFYYYLISDVCQPLSQIRLSVSVSLGAGQIIFLAGINATENKVSGASFCI